MSSISFPFKMLIAGSALAGLTLLACGGDDSSGGGTNTNTNNATGDAGKSTKDSGAASKDAGITIAHAEPGDDCDPSAKLPYALCSGCGATYCTVTCGSDGTYGDCVNPVASFGDGGLLNGLKTDAGTYTVKDGSVSFMVPGSDASIDIPATACPDKFTCSMVGALIGIAVSYCSDNGVTPPSCTTTADCTSMGFKLATCGASPVGGMACLQLCK
ncbi:MAG: hypothetical protein JWN04_3563 [Myxococcaceae bacterium]|nr:hypothetical protein [Myxococcaceae bacterium]